MKSTASIRVAKENEWQIIQRLNYEVFEASLPYDQHLNMKWPFEKAGIAYYKEAVSKPKYCCLLAEIGSEPVGYLIGVEHNYTYRLNKVAEIDNMGVIPTFRDKGIGTQLITEFKKWCKSQAITDVKVNTYYGYSEAINFYKKQGLVPIDITLEGTC